MVFPRDYQNDVLLAKLTLAPPATEKLCGRVAGFNPVLEPLDHLRKWSEKVTPQAVVVPGAQNP